MRDIKFRVWDKLTKHMHICGEDVHDTISFEIETNKAYYYNLQNGCGSLREDSDYVLMQYTGLKDKNGKEIYEGDILELNKDGRIFYGTPDGLLAKKYQLVGFKDGAFMTCRNKHLIDDYDTYLWIISKYSTVAGNIYDNKNLLEEGE